LEIIRKPKEPQQEFILDAVISGPKLYSVVHCFSGQFGVSKNCERNAPLKA
jgi:hypothetical protein